MQLSFNPYLVFVIHMTLSALLTLWVFKRRIALDAANERSSHVGSTPSAGGIGLVLSILIGAGYLLPLDWPLMTGAILISVVSLLDDIRSSSKRLRIFTQLAAALLIVLTSGLITDPDSSKIVIALIATIWIIGMSNAFNFMDGLDGFAGSTAVVSGLFLAIIAYSLRIESAYWLGTLITASSAGFLLFNWAPAKIFMGDVGSASLGFIFAAAAITFVSELPWWIIPLLLLHFVFDTSFTLVRRLLAGENITQAHRSHIYQLLNRLGWSHAQLASLTIVIGCFQGIAAVVMLRIPESQQLVVGVSFALIYFGIALFITCRAKNRTLL